MPASASPQPSKPSRVTAPDEGMVMASRDGSTIIRPDVVAKIAGLAIREVKGVHTPVATGAGQAIARATRSLTGAEYRKLGVNVEVGQIEVAVDARVVTDYGVSIPDIAKEVRSKVSERIQAMTGLVVKEVNLEVVDLYFADDDAPASPDRRVR